MPAPDDPAPWIAPLLQAADSLYPTGAYAHSFGLEGLIQEGAVRDVGTLRAFLLGQALPPLARTDLPIAAGAWDAAAAPPDWPRLRELCFLGQAVRGAREPREASAALGRQRIEMAARLRGGIATVFLSRAAEGGWPIPACVAAAIEGRAIGAPSDAVLAGIVYAAAAGWVAAAVKLLRMGQNAAQALLAEALALAPALIASARRARPEDVGSFNPWWDVAAARHESAEARLFIS
jgi:urease accessory protein